jgi:hypothetical protein
MIILVKIGTMHAAHMSARSAIVWRNGSTGSNDYNKNLAIRQASHAARVIMAPFSSGLTGHRRLAISSPSSALRYAGSLLEANEYALLYRVLKDKNVKRDQFHSYIVRKYQYASAMTTTTIQDHINQFGNPLTIHVRHRMPITIPFTGRILGTMHWTGAGFYRDVTSSATLPLETAESDDDALGIGYDSELLSIP